ncbi:carboxypeptidase-like regulatory domain-containing protein [uncultured Draconibacterium sp.]|uniref:carboxypeptidase-like regulatory domain-containing protein n=1 Tax=uncultured Draconibacterium sp. TaxID=1573823 RepID=UPI0029C83FA6|nr:carboxypeptidase-like regulatory domain-containing protein [uncultured Draconibacterium sp.]
MNNLRKVNIVFAIALLLSLIYSQNIVAGNIELSGKIINSKTNEIIPYATIAIPKNSKGTISDSLGIFKLIINEKDLNCKIYISALGFFNDSMLINEQNLEEILIVNLQPKTYSLTEIKVTPQKYKLSKFGITKPNKKGWWNYGMPGLQRAIYIPNNKKEKCLISHLNVFIDTVGFPAAPLRVRIYSVQKNRIIPDEDLLKGNVIIRNSKGGEFVAVDLSSHQIIFPENGLFIGIEWLYDNDSYYYTKVMKRKSKNGKDNSFELKGYGPTLGITSKKDETIYWKKLVGEEWKANSKTSNKIHPVMFLTLAQKK